VDLGSPIGKSRTFGFLLSRSTTHQDVRYVIDNNDIAGQQHRTYSLSSTLHSTLIIDNENDCIPHIGLDGLGPLDNFDIAMLSSPPPRMNRSPGGHQPWETETRVCQPKLAVIISRANDQPALPRNKYNSPRRYSTQPLPPLPSSPMCSPAPALPSYATPPTTRRSPIPLGSPSTPKRPSTPPLRTRSKSNSKLLPALPLSINTQLSSPVQSLGNVVMDDSPYDGIQITVSDTTYTPSSRPRRVSCVSPKSTSPAILSPQPLPAVRAPPRPARRQATESDLLPPQANFRVSSPSGSSVSTITGDTTPKTMFPPERADSAPPASNIPFVTATSTPMANKRDSAQRRLSALRGLVANLDFNQHWSISENIEQEEGEVFGHVVDRNLKRRKRWWNVTISHKKMYLQRSHREAHPLLIRSIRVFHRCHPAKCLKIMDGLHHRERIQMYWKRHLFGKLPYHADLFRHHLDDPSYWVNPQVSS